MVSSALNLLLTRALRDILKRFVMFMILFFTHSFAFFERHQPLFPSPDRGGEACQFVFSPGLKVKPVLAFSTEGAYVSSDTW